MSFDESGTNRAECSRKVPSWRRVAGAIRSLVNARDLQLECARMLHETLLVPVLIYRRRGELEGCTDGQPQMIAGY